jgi:Recombinase.
MSILKNEKYAGDALLQKTYVTDCISKKTKKNTGELPMYLVTDHHAAIIDRNTFKRAQVEIENTNFQLTEYDDVMTRGFIERITVIDKHTIKFKGGYETVQTLD